MVQLSQYEEEMYRAWRLGVWDAADGYSVARGLASILKACRSDESLEAAIETREQRLVRQLDEERTALRRLREVGYGGTD
jgi:hypothetical protein